MGQSQRCEDPQKLGACCLLLSRLLIPSPLLSLPLCPISVAAPIPLPHPSCCPCFSAPLLTTHWLSQVPTNLQKMAALNHCIHKLTLSLSATKFLGKELSDPNRLRGLPLTQSVQEAGGQAVPTASLGAEICSFPDTVKFAPEILTSTSTWWHQHHRALRIKWGNLYELPFEHSSVLPKGTTLFLFGNQYGVEGKHVGIHTCSSEPKTRP